MGERSRKRRPGAAGRLLLIAVTVATAARGNA
jgi:hypothetical protein